jgi:hypothetical protein
MAAHSIEPARDSPWYARTACSRAYLVAAIRAGAIAVVLLGVLALLVLV